MQMRYVILVVGLLVALGGNAPCRGAERQPIDPFMGDWQGTMQGADNPAIAAQIIALGNGRYRANIVQKLYTPDPPLAVMEGQAHGQILTFAPDTTIAKGIFQGSLPGPRGGTFTMKPTQRLSPTLGAQPPAGAVVLFSGKNLDAWRNPLSPYGVIDLKRELKPAQHCAAYLRNAIHSDREQPVRLEIGSDDGVKVWLDGTLVHRNNASRGLMPGQDKVDATLKPGWNEVLVKISQGGGDWGAHMRVVDRQGNPIEGLQVRYAAKSAQGNLLDTLGKRVDGTFLSWEIAGPYTRNKISAKAVLDTPFPPETDPDKVTWKRIGEREKPRGTRWELVPGNAMRIVPNSGSLVSKDVFGDMFLHVEFRTPFMPKARGQARGNSGVYIQGRYEVQVLDSYGLEGLDNECGGIYKVARPLVNMCAPPGQWQTYDIDFTAPKLGPDGTIVSQARITVRHNGVVIHDHVEIPKPTGGGNTHDIGKPGPLLLQDHHNPVEYRNIWVLPKKT